MLCRMAFHLSSKVVTYIWIIVFLKQIYVIKVVEYLFHSRLACHLLNLANKPIISLVPAYSQ